MKPPPGRVAVVLIHGMGEQRPMTTLRRFVAPYAETRNPDRMWSVPDRYGQLFELHTYAVPREDDGAKDMPPPRGQVDFYEGYWAAELRGTRMSHLLPFLAHVIVHLVRPSSRRRALPLRLAWVWIPLLVLLVLGVLGLWWALTNFGEAPWWHTVMKLAGVVIIAPVTAWMTGSVGDVARYLDNSVTNVEVRQKVRENVVGLLQGLHDGGRYRQIILIGHSLGGVVAYDALRLLWARRMLDSDVSDVNLDRLTTAATALAEAANQPRGKRRRAIRHEDHDHGFATARDGYTDAQAALFATLGERSDSRRWLISDLITVGSPVAYPDLLMTAPGLSVQDLVNERELPRCPPVLADPATIVQAAGGTGPNYCFRSRSGKDGQEITVFHHAAAFTATKWTNIYAHADFAGNEIPSELGLGVVNVRLSKNSAGKPAPWAHIPAFSHTQYWKKAEAQQAIWSIIDQAARAGASANGPSGVPAVSP